MKNVLFDNILQVTMKKITKRDVLFFLLGIVIMFIIELIFDWKGSVKSFNEGFEAGSGHSQPATVDSTK